MADSNDIQKTIDQVTADRDKWSAKLMEFNAQLISAKKAKDKRRVKDAIKNAEQAINDLDKRLKKLDQDLSSSSKTETRNKHKDILAEQGISAGAEIAKTIGSTVQAVVPALLNGEPTNTTRSANASDPLQFVKDNKTYFIIGGVVLAVIVLLFTMFKKKK